MEMLPYFFIIIKGLIEESLEMDERGQTLVEYALIIAFVAIAIISALAFFRVNLSNYYEIISNEINEIL
jgi:Flp pilus assembly pilin Flp